MKTGSALLEVTAEPHLGCKKFSNRYGRDALLFVNSDTSKSLNLRGVNTRVVQGGTVRSGDTIEKING